jgi:hypothetical protein
MRVIEVVRRYPVTFRVALAVLVLFLIGGAVVGGGTGMFLAFVLWLLVVILGLLIHSVAIGGAGEP